MLGLQLQFYRLHEKFPKEVKSFPFDVQKFIATQLEVPFDKKLLFYDWKRTANNHRKLILQHIGKRKTEKNKVNLFKKWLKENKLPYTQNYYELKEASHQYFRQQKWSPFSEKGLERYISSGVSEFNKDLLRKIEETLTETTRSALSKLFEASDSSELTTPFSFLKQDLGNTGRETIKEILDKIELIRSLNLPKFSGFPLNPIKNAYHKVHSLKPTTVKRHCARGNFSQLASYLFVKHSILVDEALKMLIDILNKISIRAIAKLEKQVLVKHSSDREKIDLFYSICVLMYPNPDKTIREIIFPVLSQEKIKTIALEKSQKPYIVEKYDFMMKSYTYYRSFLPKLLENIEFKSIGEKDEVLKALEIITKYASTKNRYIQEKEELPLKGIVPKKLQRPIGLRENKKKIERKPYELFVLQALRDKLKCRALWVENSYENKNPATDCPEDFYQKRKDYYAELNHPLSSKEFIKTLKNKHHMELEKLSKGYSKNKYFDIKQEKKKSFIKLSPLRKLPEPLPLLKKEIHHRLNTIPLLDILKEVDLLTGFSSEFQTLGFRSRLKKEERQKRFLLAIYAYGTNMGIRPVIKATPDMRAEDIINIVRFYFSESNLKRAIKKAVNATFQARDEDVWGTVSSLCASDSTRFSAWSANPTTQFHNRYKDTGLMAYWHVTKDSICIHGDVARCSQSEIPAMIKGILHHETQAKVEKNCVDSHGQSLIAFAFSHLLGFKLLPRLKNIKIQKLYGPPHYKNINALIKRPIKWHLIEQYYDEMIKYSIALKHGVTEPDILLKTFFSKNNRNPLYTALTELGRVNKTIFLCEYLHSKTLRQEVQSALNTVERWNGINDVIFHGKKGVISTNNTTKQTFYILCLHLLQSCMVYINTILIQNIVKSWSRKTGSFKKKAKQLLSPLIHEHINPYGEFTLDMKKRLELTA